MRLWDYRLLPYLDDFHIVAQWRELLAIKGAIDKKGTPNHRLVNKVLDYSIYEFKHYAILVVNELKKRGLRYDKNKYIDLFNWQCDKFNNYITPEDVTTNECYRHWHNNRYLTQCYYILQEKFDCGIVSESAWIKIREFYSRQKSKITWLYCDDLVMTVEEPKLDIEAASKKLDEFYNLYKNIGDKE